MTLRSSPSTREADVISEGGIGAEGSPSSKGTSAVLRGAGWAGVSRLPGGALRHLGLELVGALLERFGLGDIVQLLAREPSEPQPELEALDSIFGGGGSVLERPHRFDVFCARQVAVRQGEPRCLVAGLEAH